jgi:Class II Aldolase and Adducin N-terminal domain
MTAFIPTADKLLPDLTLKEEMVLLARTLWREGYDDHLAGHITIGLGDGTLLCSPWLLTWAEFRAADVIRVDLEGRVVEGDWPMPPGVQLHLELPPGPSPGGRDRPPPSALRHRLGRPAPSPRGLRPELGSGRGYRRPGRRVQTSGQRSGGGSSGGGGLGPSRHRRPGQPRGPHHRSQRPGCPPTLGGLRTALPERLVRRGSQRWRRVAGRCARSLRTLRWPTIHRFWEAMARAELRADPTILEPC